MALRLNPLPTQTFALPQMASLRSPKFRMASTLRSGSKSVLYLSDLLLLTQFMHFSFFFSLTSFFTLSFFFSVFSISLMSQTKPNNFENHAICWCFVFFFTLFSNSLFYFLHQLFFAQNVIPHVSFCNLMDEVEWFNFIQYTHCWVFFFLFFVFVCARFFSGLVGIGKGLFQSTKKTICV